MMKLVTWQQTTVFCAPNVILRRKKFSGEVSGKNEDYPETLRISVGANSTTNETMKNRLGIYKKTNSTRNGRPEWEQVTSQNVLCANFWGQKLGCDVF